MAENSISKHLIFKIFWGSMPPDPPTRKHWNRDSIANNHPLPINLTVIRYVTHMHREVTFKIGWKHRQMNHKHQTKFINESRIIEVKQDRNHEYPKSNDTASTPETVLVSIVPKKQARWHPLSVIHFYYLLDSLVQCTKFHRKSMTGSFNTEFR